MSVIPDKEVTDIIMEMRGETSKMCFQCGNCTGLCPWTLVSRFSVRKIIRQVQLGLINFENASIWSCSTCGKCVVRCPRGVEAIDVMMALRQIITEMEMAKVADSLRISLKNIDYMGNPL